ncbi:hypothetical protein RI129_002646 [Pyrocoelia pectoralis]|uniref:Farnesyl pyrophosphate synthase n=1 Tax=Pyrocoelia pectoralis TaxID=417401 RepID=A0AAN7VJD8_9COLE
MFCNIIKPSTGLQIIRNVRLLRNISKTSAILNNENITKYMSRPPKNFNSRTFSTINGTIAPTTSSNLVTKEEIKEFMSVFPDLLRDIRDHNMFEDLHYVKDRITKCLEYNVPLGKKSRGLITLSSYKLLESPEKLTSENIRLAQILGWCVELLHSSFLINDDIIDSAETRRGLPCWYLVEGIHALNDALFIENGLYLLLKKYFHDHHCYVPTIELFHKTTAKTSLGETLDVLSTKNGKPQFDYFTVNNYNCIVNCKTAYYSLHLPLALAMYLAGKYDPEMHRHVSTISLEIGHFFQVQDDFLDCFGDSSKMGKNNTDIVNGKCSWLAVQALQRASLEQRIIFEQNYGKTNLGSVAIIRSLYEDLDLPNVYAVYEEETCNLIRSHIQQVPQGLPHRLYFNILEGFYRRSS